MTTLTSFTARLSRNQERKYFQEVIQELPLDRRMKPAARRRDYRCVAAVPPRFT
jgi:hypothetical protein